eukprot:TRINITY_DN80350_c0_g1_i1.p1 TRINITY_DN80350_c0_g1~~TRINITY_DN80350_c0_g1_i1.p1  ORF type:complete len:385 (+),score=88.41 TRINITY_DN80350_c0_g1_i1:89-1243(+)
MPAMRSSIMGLVGAVKDMPRGSAVHPTTTGQRWGDDNESSGYPLPTLLSHRSRNHTASVQKESVTTLRWEHFPPDLENKIGSGAYGGVYPVKGSPDKVVKLFRRGDWSDIVKESSFAHDMKALEPDHFVDCIGIGSSPEDDEGAGGLHFAVFERAEGVALSEAAHCYNAPDGIKHVRQALCILDQLATIMIGMMMPDDQGQLHFHLDLKADNIMIAKDAEREDGLKVTLIDYGVVKTCSAEDPAARDSVLQMFRWLGWELLWVLASESFRKDGSAAELNPWEQLPDGFRPFFQRSDFRPPAYKTAGINADKIKTALQDGFFDQVMSPMFRKQWTSPQEAKKCLGRLLGDLFYGVAAASDCEPFETDFSTIREHIRELKKFAAHA